MSDLDLGGDDLASAEALLVHARAGAGGGGTSMFEGASLDEAADAASEASGEPSQGGADAAAAQAARERDAQEAADEKALKEIFEKHGLADEPPAEAEDEAEEEEGEKAPPEKGEAPAEESKPEAAAADLEEALAILRRSKLPDSVREKMTREEILAYADEQRGIQTGIQAKLDERSDLIRRLERLEKSPAEPAGSDPQNGDVEPPARHPDGATLREARESLTKALRDDLGERSGATVSEAVAGLASGMIAAELEPVVNAIRQMGAGLEHVLEGEQRRSLSTTYGSSALGEKWDDVSKKARSLLAIPNGDYQGPGGIEAAYRDAAMLAIGAAPAPETTPAPRKPAPPTTPKTKTPRRPMSDAQKEDAALGRILRKHGLT